MPEKIKELSAGDICRMVNKAYEAVDNSKFGPIVQYPDPNNVLNKQVNQLAFGVFTIVLTGLVRKI